MNTAAPRRLLLAGCGDLGIRLAARLDAWQCHGLRRRVDRLPAGIRGEAADLTDPSSLDGVAGRWDAVVYTPTPSERSPGAYRAAYPLGLSNLLSRIETGRLVFVSSTAVYGQDAGEWVDESSATEPAAFNGEILLEAERLALDHGGTVVRFSGIYGPGRDWLLRRLESGPPECRREPPVWTNRIHAEDCARVLAHVLAEDHPAPVLCASDDEPAPRWEVLEWLAGRMGVPGPVEVADGPGQGKRISNRRLRASGLALQYPDFRAGYGELLS